MDKELVCIKWKDEKHDWPWFYLLGSKGNLIHLQGADYPDGSAKHDGDCFYVPWSEIRMMITEKGGVNDGSSLKKKYSSMLDLSADQIRLMAGEITADEMRLVQAILAAIRKKMEE